MTTILAFIVTLAVLIVVHEYGHYRVAVACGVKVLRFSVGFGRVLLRWQRGDTEFVVCALPLGGYVRMLDEREGPVPPADAHRAFNRQRLSRRAAIVAAGPAANLLLAVLLYATTHWIGIDEPQAVLGTPPASGMAATAGLRAGDRVLAASADGNDWQDVRSLPDLRWHVMQAALRGQALSLQVAGDGGGSRNVRLPLDALEPKSVDAQLMKQIGLPAPFSEARAGDVKPGGPAAAAGLRRDDRIVALDGATVPDAQWLVERIRNSPAAPQRWTVERAGQRLQLQVTPRAARDADDKPIGRIDAVVGQPPATVLVRHGPIDGLVQGAQRTWDVSALTVQMLGRMLIGQASLKNLSGPLTIADYAGQSVQQGLPVYLAFLALVSVSLGVLNLLPLPMLDGGHLMYYIFEAATGRPVSELWLARLQRGGIALLLTMMSVALFNDVARLLGVQ